MQQVKPMTRTSRQPLSTRSKVTVAALVINACAQFVGVIAELALGEGWNIPHLIIGILVLLASGLAATGIRWTALLGAFVVLITNVLLITRPTNYLALLHPGADVGHFAVLAIALIAALVAVLAGIGATIQNERSSLG